MNLLLGYEMGAALLRRQQEGINDCWSQAQARAGQSQGPLLNQNVDRIEKGTFPDQLGRLRGQLSLNASGDEPAVVVLECGPRVMTLLANDNAPSYGIWSVTEEKFYPLKAEEMYGTRLTTLIKELCQGVGNLWVAYFLSSKAVPETVAETAVPKKKTVVRKRAAAATEVPAVVSEPSVVANNNKKPALSEEEAN